MVKLAINIAAFLFLAYVALHVAVLVADVAGYDVMKLFDVVAFLFLLYAVMGVFAFIANSRQ